MKLRAAHSSRVATKDLCIKMRWRELRRGVGERALKVRSSPDGEVIRKRFRVAYHRDHVGCLMRHLGWSHQKPQKRALERNEAKIRRFGREEWPRLRKTLRGWVPTSSLPTKGAFS